jgi:hypothetical protein
MKYALVHCKHVGCCENYKPTGQMFTQIHLNPPKIFLFDNKFSANEFFHEYMNDVDVIDERCKKGDQVEHIDHCTCGIIELDDNGDTRLFYNKINQIYLLETGVQVLTVPDEIHMSVHNANLTRKFFRTCKQMEREQREAYVELGNLCAKSIFIDDMKLQKEKEKEKDNENEEEDEKAKAKAFAKSGQDPDNKV